MKQPSSADLSDGESFGVLVLPVRQWIEQIYLVEKRVKKKRKSRDFQSEILGKSLVEEGVNHG